MQGTRWPRRTISLGILSVLLSPGGGLAQSSGCRKEVEYDIKGETVKFILEPENNWKTKTKLFCDSNCLYKRDDGHTGVFCFPGDGKYTNCCQEALQSDDIGEQTNRQLEDVFNPGETVGNDDYKLAKKREVNPEQEPFNFAWTGLGAEGGGANINEDLDEYSALEREENLLANYGEEMFAPNVGPGLFDPEQPSPGMIEPGQPSPGMVEPGQPSPGMVEPGQPSPGMVKPGQPSPGLDEPEPPQPGSDNNPEPDEFTYELKKEEDEDKKLGEEVDEESEVLGDIGGSNRAGLAKGGTRPEYDTEVFLRERLVKGVEEEQEVLEEVAYDEMADALDAEEAMPDKPDTPFEYHQFELTEDRLENLESNPFKKK